MTQADKVRAFQEALQRKAKLLAQLPQAVTHDVTMALVDGVLDRMPVKSGHAMNNVQVSDSPASLPEVPGTDRTGASSRQRCEAQLSAIEPGRSVYVQLTVPYALPLEHGSSQQAPSGMFALTAQDVGAKATQIGELAAQRVLQGGA